MMDKAAEANVNGDHVPEPATVLRDAWGIDAPIGPPHRGISRTTWRAGAVGWLARETARRRDETEAEIRLLATLAATASFAVPLPVPTLRGPYITQIDGHIWTLCRHIPGERVADEPSSYRHLVTILVAVHRELRDLDPHLAVLPESLLSRAAAITRAPPRDLMPAAQQAVAWLRGRIGTLNALPPQIIHGDFGIPNVLVATDDPARFGILDWELSSHDSPIFDLAQIAFGTIAFSRAQAPPDQLALLTDWYAEAGGQHFSEDQLATALVAGRLAQLAWLRGRVTRGEESLIESVRFLDQRLRRVLRWLEQRG